MLYETRRVLLGFRLKLTFDESLNKDMSCIFVDVSKIFTVGSLLNNIVERFQIPHNSFLTVQNCKVLPSENIHVLMDVNSVKINGPSASTSELRGTRSDVSEKENASIKTIDSVSSDQGDVVDGKTKFPKPRAPKRPMREGIAATIKLLLEEAEMDKIGKECSGLSLSDDNSKVQSTSHQETMNVNDTAETKCHSEELNDLMSDACSDLNTQKKRKRKRKHTKNREIEDQSSASSSFTEPIPVLRQNTSNTHRKHIRFNDEDDDGQYTSVHEKVVSDMSQSSTHLQNPKQPSLNQAMSRKPCQQHLQSQQLEKKERLLRQSMHYIQQLQQEKLLEEQFKKQYQTENMEDLFGWSGRGIKQSGTISNILNGQPGDEETFNHSRTMEIGDESSTETRSVFRSQTSQKPTKNQGQQSTSTVNATSLKPKKNYNSEASYERPKSSLLLYNGSTSDDKNTDSDNLGSPFINLPRLSESENKEYQSKHERVEKELATLLMCKQLNTSMEYTVQFANENGSKSLWSKDVQNSPISQPNFSAETSKISNLNLQNVETKKNHENDLSEQMEDSSDYCEFLKQVKVDGRWIRCRKPYDHENEVSGSVEASSDDCEFLKQVKLAGNQIRLRKPDGTWTIVTPEIANAELPSLDVPQENQSIVFRIIYLNKNFTPTSSELLYGQIVSYKANTNKLAIDIPEQFVRNIVEDCGDEALPETIVPIIGSTYEVDLSILIEPKVIS